MSECMDKLNVPKHTFCKVTDTAAAFTGVVRSTYLNPTWLPGPQTTYLLRVPYYDFFT